MTLNEIETALGQHLADIDDMPPIAWPNRTFTPPADGLYVEFRHVPGERVDDTVSGGYPYQSGIALLTVVTKAGEFSTAANELAQSIADAFPKALRLAVGGGFVLMYAPARFGTPFQDGAYWRQPISVFYLTEG